jgi:hypothetical protein
MNPSFESTERTDLSTQKLPAIPPVQEMQAWDEEKVLRWISKEARTFSKVII